MEQPTPSPVQQPQPPIRPRTGWWVRAVAIVLVVSGAAIIAYPFWPLVRYTIHRGEVTLPYATKLTADSPALKSLASLPVIENKPAPSDNRMVIPSIGVDMPVLEGPDERVLDRGGVWHIPKTSDPVAGGNMVVSGHRWKYLPPSNMTLYLLDKIKDGEPVIVYWQGKEYDYTITGREIVNPNQVSILQDTPEPKLTIFTCTPLFSTKQRLVLYGQLIS